MTTWDPQANELFLKLLELPSGDERSALLDRECAGDAALRAEVESLLAAVERAGSFLESPAPALAPTLDLPLAERPGTVIGPYKLLEQIGEGGMGVVFMAEQTQPVRRKVALKLIRPGLDGRLILARFGAERQALALMDHPNIARVLDAGATPEGRPYFVMELVKGLPITRHCDEHRLTPRERLELFLPVCHAIQHAHQKGIIHRDLKPSNVLVGTYDGRPVVKVIDFGVAKAVGPKLTDRTLFTEFGAVVGTPEYMSPEQARLDNLDIDTRSDVYSLGVLLYELLTGTTPLDRRRLRDAAFMEVLRVIREVEPPTPSTRLSTTEELPSVAARRQTEPARLTRLVRGELDWIVMKALEKDRNRRYETASGLAGDVQRYLSGEAVEAHPPSAAYRLRKLARRYRVALTTAALVTAALLTGTLVSTWQAFRATKAEALATARREEAEEARKEAVTNLGKAREVVDQMLTRVAGERLADVPQMEPVRRALLEDALRFYQEFLKQTSDPDLRLETGRAWQRVAVIYCYFEQYREAEDACRQSVQLLEGLATDARPEPAYSELLADGYDLLAVTERRGAARHEEAERHLERALELYERLAAGHRQAPRYRERQVMIRLGLAETRRDLGRSARFEEEYRRALAVAEELAAGSRKEYRQTHAHCLHHLSLCLTRSKPAEAEQLRRRALALFRELLAESPHNQDIRFYVSWCHNLLANMLRDAGRPAEAEAHYAQAIAQGERLVADFPHRIHYGSALCAYHLDLGEHLESARRPAEAERSYRQGWAAIRAGRIGSEARPEWHWFYRAGQCGQRLAQLLAAAGRTREAGEHYRQILTFWEQLAAQCPAVAGYRYELGRTYEIYADFLRSGKRPAEADAARRQAIPALEEAFRLARSCPNSGLHPGAGSAREALVRAYHRAGRTAEAVALVDELRDDLTRQQAERGVDHADVLRLRHQLYWAYQALGWTDRIIVLYEEAIRLGSTSPGTCNALAWTLATCPEVDLRDPQRAVELARKAVELDPKNDGYWNTLGTAQFRAGDYRGAVASFQKSCERLGGGTAYDFFFLAMCHHRLNDPTAARAWFDKALGWVAGRPPESLARSGADDLRRFEAEARELLGIPNEAKPGG